MTTQQQPYLGAWDEIPCFKIRHLVIQSLIYHCLNLKMCELEQWCPISLMMPHLSRDAPSPSWCPISLMMPHLSHDVPSPSWCPISLMMPHLSHDAPSLSWCPISLMMPHLSHDAPSLSWCPISLMMPHLPHDAPSLSWCPIPLMMPHLSHDAPSPSWCPISLMMPHLSHDAPSLSWCPISLMMPHLSHDAPSLSWCPISLMMPHLSHDAPYPSWCPISLMMPHLSHDAPSPSWCPIYLTMPHLSHDSAGQHTTISSLTQGGVWFRPRFCSQGYGSEWGYPVTQSNSRKCQHFSGHVKMGWLISAPRETPPLPHPHPPSDHTVMAHGSPLVNRSRFTPDQNDMATQRKITLFAKLASKISIIIFPLFWLNYSVSSNSAWDFHQNHMLCPR